MAIGSPSIGSATENRVGSNPSSAERAHDTGTASQRAGTAFRGGGRHVHDRVNRLTLSVASTDILTNGRKLYAITSVPF